MEPQLTCKYCGYPISANFFFCPNCGKKLHEPPITIARQIGLYALSVFLPPLGLWPGIKYLQQKDPKAKIVGSIAIILTIVSILITIQLTMSFLTGSLGGSSAGNQIQELQNLGY